LKSPLAKNILGKWGDKISGYITKFTTRVKELLSKLTGKAGQEGAEKAGKEGAEKAGKQGAEKAGKQGAEKAGKQGAEKATIEVTQEVFTKRFTLANCFSSSFCDTPNILKKLFNIIPSDTVFNPSKVKVLSKSNVSGREIIEVQLENGNKTLFYKSSGANVATTGKQSGEWFAIPGFAENGWFVKTKESIALVRGENAYLTSMSKFLQENGADALGKSVSKNMSTSAVENAIKLLPLNSSAVSKELLPAIINKSSSLVKVSDVAVGNNGAVVMSKLGMGPNKTFRFGKKRVKVKEVVGEYIDFEEILPGGQTLTKKVKVWDFLKTHILKPSAKLNTVAVPLITKATLRLFNNGTLNVQELKSMAGIDSAQAQNDLMQLSALVAEYEGGTGKYTVNQNAKIVQQSLMKLGYPLPRFKDDGKFGPETMGALKKFQQDNGLTSSLGKMDRATARKLAEVLKTKNIPNSEGLQNSLSKI
jgi:hypothetical protein